MVWWLAHYLAHDTDKVGEVVPLIGPLAQLVAAANNTNVHEKFRHLVPERNGDPDHSLVPAVFMDPAISLVNALFPDPGNLQRAHFADDLAKIIDSHGVGHDLIACLRDTFELNSFDEPVPVDQPAP